MKKTREHRKHRNKKKVRSLQGFEISAVWIAGILINTRIFEE
jgi:hypothetical protein